MLETPWKPKKKNMQQKLHLNVTIMTMDGNDDGDDDRSD